VRAVQRARFFRSTAAFGEERLLGSARKRFVRRRNRDGPLLIILLASHHVFQRQPLKMM